MSSSGGHFGDAPTSHADGPYEGGPGQTRKEWIHWSTGTGGLIRLRVHTAVNAQQDPGLSERLLSGSLNQVRLPGASAPQVVPVPVVYHDEVLRLFVLVLPDSWRAREIEERIKLLQRLAADPSAVPRYVLHASVVYGSEALVELVLSTEAEAVRSMPLPSDDPVTVGLADDDEVLAAQAGDLASREARVRGLEERLRQAEALLIEREREADQRAEQLDYREQQLERELTGARAGGTDEPSWQRGNHDGAAGRKEGDTLVRDPESALRAARIADAAAAQAEAAFEDEVAQRISGRGPTPSGSSVGYSFQSADLDDDADEDEEDLTGQSLELVAEMPVESVETVPFQALDVSDLGTDELIASLEVGMLRVDAALHLCRRREVSALPALFATLERMGPQEILHLAPELVRFGDAAADHFLEALGAESALVRRASALALGALRHEGAKDALVELLLEEESESWRDIALALAEIGESALRTLLDLSPRVDGAPKARVVDALAAIGRVSGRALLEDVATAGFLPGSDVAYEALEVMGTGAGSRVEARDEGTVERFMRLFIDAQKEAEREISDDDILDVDDVVDTADMLEARVLGESDERVENLSPGSAEKKVGNLDERPL